jgi:hypothetical protein
MYRVLRELAIDQLLITRLRNVDSKIVNELLVHFSKSRLGSVGSKICELVIDCLSLSILLSVDSEIKNELSLTCPHRYCAASILRY